MALIDDLRTLAGQEGLTAKESGSTLTLERVVAERKAFLSKKKLEYRAKIKIDDSKKELIFSEMLKESGSGLSMNAGDDMSAGFGFKAGTYSSGMKGRSGTLEEQSNLFGKQYSYAFDFAAVRKKVEALTQNSGYTFSYHIF